MHFYCRKKSIGKYLNQGNIAPNIGTVPILKRLPSLNLKFDVRDFCMSKLNELNQMKIILSMISKCLFKSSVFLEKNAVFFLKFQKYLQEMEYPNFLNKHIIASF